VIPFPFLLLYRENVEDCIKGGGFSSSKVHKNKQQHIRIRSLRRWGKGNKFWGLERPIAGCCCRCFWDCQNVNMPKWRIEMEEGRWKEEDNGWEIETEEGGDLGKPAATGKGHPNLGGDRAFMPG
jgi:hypothetical protein